MTRDNLWLEQAPVHECPKRTRLLQERPQRLEQGMLHLVRYALAPRWRAFPEEGKRGV